MKEDYLWDRTGSDAEIERLESLLGGLAFRPADPPELPAREFVLEPVPRGWLFKLGLSFGTAAAACLLLIAMFALKQEDRQVTTVKEIEPVMPTITATAPIVESPNLDYQKASAAPQRRSKPKKRIRREAKAVPAPQPRPLPVITLTAEEADAYRQLMTALSITGTNLNIVRDKINGTED